MGPERPLFSSATGFGPERLECRAYHLFATHSEWLAASGVFQPPRVNIRRCGGRLSTDLHRPMRER